MKAISNFLLILGLLIVVYAVFSKFYGAPSIALKGLCSSRSLFLGGMSLLLLSLIASVRDLCKK